MIRLIRTALAECRRLTALAAHGPAADGLVEIRCRILERRGRSTKAAAIRMRHYGPRRYP